MEETTYSFGYCTNIHAGATLDEVKSNLLKYAASVQQQVNPHGRLPLGLWLAARSADALLVPGRLRDFREWLAAHSFHPYTFNGFPQGDFHQPVVKHAVYHPDWRDRSRLEYSLSLARILAGLLPDESTGSVSTLPLGWPYTTWREADYGTAAGHLLELARGLDQIRQDTGREIVFAIESEPGCVLNTTDEICDFFSDYLFASGDEPVVRRHLGVCHDICHSSVMFEPQAEVLKRYRDLAIRIGKVQVSSAVHVPWDQYRGDVRAQTATFEQLRGFDEPKYLHQATQADDQLKLRDFAEDLPQALAEWIDSSPSGFPNNPWRVHFHVPIFVGQFDQLRTTQADIVEAVRYLELHRETRVGDYAWFTGHYEVETYAWPVVPVSLAVTDLAQGIAEELTFFSHMFSQLHLSTNH